MARRSIWCSRPAVSAAVWRLASKADFKKMPEPNGSGFLFFIWDLRSPAFPPGFLLRLVREFGLVGQSQKSCRSARDRPGKLHHPMRRFRYLPFDHGEKREV